MQTPIGEEAYFHSRLDLANGLEQCVWALATFNYNFWLKPLLNIYQPPGKADGNKTTRTPGFEYP